MDYEAVLNEIKSWQKDELLFRDYFLVQAGKLSQALFLEKHHADPVNLSIAMHPDRISAHRHENEFIAEKRNVSIVKHPRYLPLFFHSHAFFEMIYVLSGECTQHFRDESVQLKTGYFCILAPNVEHEIEVFDDDSVVLNILVRYSTYLDVFAGTLRDSTQISQFFVHNLYARKKTQYMLFRADADEMVRNYVLDMYLEQRHADAYSDRMMCSLLTLFFTQLIRRYEPTIKLPHTGESAEDGRQEILHYITAHYADVTIEKVAEEFHFSRQYCSRLIKEMTGQTFTDLVTNIRLQQGENLLQFTDLSIADVSDQVGYKNPETFIRLFKRKRGCTPGNYRRDNE